MNEAERKILIQSAKQVVSLSQISARLVRSNSAIRLTLSQLLPDFEHVYLSHFAEEEPEAHEAREQILAAAAELALLLEGLPDVGKGAR